MELADLELPNGISVKGKTLLKAVLAAHAICAKMRDRKSRSPRRTIKIARGGCEFEVPQRLENPRIPIGGPRLALQSLEIKSMSNDQRMRWFEEARVNAILGSCKLSLKSVQSGWRTFRAFAGKRACLHIGCVGFVCCVTQKAPTPAASGCCHRHCHCCWHGRLCLGPKEHCRIT